MSNMLLIDLEQLLLRLHNDLFIHFLELLDQKKISQNQIAKSTCQYKEKKKKLTPVVFILPII